MRMTVAICVILAVWSAHALAANCASPSVELESLQQAMAAGRFVSYQPTSLKVIGGRPTEADDASIRADLQVLRPYFDGLITYGALNGAERIPDVAASLGFRAVIVGVWDPTNPKETGNAIAAWERNRKLVVGVSLGNEIILSKRGTWAMLQSSLADMRRRAPGLPVTVTEPFAQFLDERDAQTLFPQMDFMLVNIHPIFESWFRNATPFNWAEFVVRVTDRLSAAFCGPILVKETGVPTGPAAQGYTEDKQRAFYLELERQLKPSRARAFSFFSAFDAPWLADAPNPMAGPHPEEAFWGLFTEARSAKALVKELKQLSPQTEK